LLRANATYEDARLFHASMAELHIDKLKAATLMATRLGKDGQMSVSPALIEKQEG
jgi:hypothetical protein